MDIYEMLLKASADFETIKKFVKEYGNDADLGEAVRFYINNPK